MNTAGLEPLGAVSAAWRKANEKVAVHALQVANPKAIFE